MPGDTRACQNCGFESRSGLNFCPSCGANLNRTEPQNESRNPYQVLQISNNAEVEVILAAYKSLAKKYHPDQNKSSQAETKMRDLNWAYHLLSDPARRKAWDQRNASDQNRREGQGSAFRQQASRQKRGSAQTPDPKPSEHLRRKNKGSNALSILAFLFVLVFLAFVCADTSQPARQTNSSSASSFIAPTSTRIPTARPTSSPVVSYKDPTCLSAFAVTQTYVGRTICVYGVVDKVNQTPEYSTIIRLRNSGTGQNEILFLSQSWVWPDLKRGDCIQATGRVFLTASYMYISLQDLYLSNSC
ncbi:MAG: DnaJ domain-containing protein [Anaerolineales bacterium]|nr:DnaJ domain-containing protein [Anaerolineales bacterium]